MRRKHQAGFSLIEVMIALAVVIVGATGIFKLNTATTRGNAFARQMSTATDFMNSWVTRLRRDALLWQTAGAPGLAATTYLSAAPNVGAAGAWLSPAVPPGDPESFAASYHGMATNTPADFVFCTQVLYNWAIPNQALSVQLRTYWMRSTQPLDGSSPFNNCGAAAPAAVTAELAQTAGGGVSRLHSVSTSFVLRRSNR